MAKHYRITFECYESTANPEISLSKTALISGVIDKPVDIFTFGLAHEEQIKLIQLSQDALLKEQVSSINSEEYCPNCPGKKLVKYGRRHSNYHDVFTDHKITIGRKRCLECGHEPGSTIQNILGHSMSADLIRLQSELGSDYPYRESQRLLSIFSRTAREINNHDRIKSTTEKIGANVEMIYQTEGEVVAIKPAEKLVLNVDGGHINTIEEGKRSFEAMTAVIYQPGALVSNKAGTHNHLASKHCSASALSDNQQQMINNTIIAALKQGLSPQTEVTALCDGADNCWQVVAALKPLAASMICILDWFHLGMKIQNIALPEELKAKLLRVKWHLWRGKVDNALIRLAALIIACPQLDRQRLEKLQIYLINNRNKIVDYRKRQKDGLVFTSNLAEATVESLINRRCKGQQHMRWSRKGLNPVLQLRAAMSSNDWDKNWKTAVMNAVVRN